MLDNLLLFMLGVCIGYTIIALTIFIINAIKDSIYSLLVNIKHLWYNKWYNKKIEQLMTTKLSHVHFSEH